MIFYSFYSLTLGFTPFYTYPSSPNWTLDFEPAFSPRFCFLLSPRSLFPTAQRFPIPKHVTSGLGVTSGDVTSGSGHVISGSGYDVILTSKRGSSCLVIAHYYCYANDLHVHVTVTINTSLLGAIQNVLELPVFNKRYNFNYKDETNSKHTVKNFQKKNSEPPVGIEPTTFQLPVGCSNH